VDKVCAHSRAQRGLILLALLLMMVLAGFGSLVGAEVWATTMQREREEQLLFVGDEYRRAITSYFQMSPTPVKVFPRSLDDLISDDRFPTPVQHLRRLYPDPITDSADWGLVKDGGAIIGVHSLSDASPLKKAGFPSRYKDFEVAKSYDQWLFVFKSQTPTPRLVRPKP